MVWHESTTHTKKFIGETPGALPRLRGRLGRNRFEPCRLASLPWKAALHRAPLLSASQARQRSKGRNALRPSISLFTTGASLGFIGRSPTEKKHGTKTCPH